MPGGDQIEGGIRGTQTTDVDDPDEPSLRDKHVAGNEVAVCHNVGEGARQIPHVRPDPADPGHVEELLAVLKAGLHPRVVGAQIPTPTRTGENTTASLDRPHALDEGGQIMSEGRRFTRVDFNRGRPGQPRLDRPRQRIASTGIADRNRFRRHEGSTTEELPRRFSLSLQPLTGLINVGRLQRKSRCESIADAEQGIHRARRGELLDRQSRPLRELAINKLTHRLHVDSQLIAVHGHCDSMPSATSDGEQTPTREKSRLSLLDTAEDGLEVDDRRSVDCLETADMYTYPINSEHAYSMQANRIGAARCPGAEDTRLRPSQVSARMHPQDTAVRLVQPGQHHDLVPDRNAAQACLNIRIQDHVRVGRPFISLPRRIGCRREGTLHASNRADRELGRGRVGHRRLPRHRSGLSEIEPAPYGTGGS